VKRFDTTAIGDRTRQRLRVKEEWANILKEGTIGNLIDTLSDGEAEIVRYLEYLFLEKKWKTARNITSLTSMGDLIGRKRNMAVSAVGFILVSHTDPERIVRLPNYGSSFFNIDQLSDWDDLAKNENASYMEKAAFTPWITPINYNIPKGTVFRTGNGIQFISLENVESRQLIEPYRAIKADPEKYHDFIRAGGWNGIKYLKVPVIQGIQTSVTLGVAVGGRFEGFVIDSTTVEAGTNAISRRYFNVFVTPPNDFGGLKEKWEQVDNIRLAGPYDKVYEIKYLSNSDRVLVKFGDGITGWRLPKGSVVSCDYLDTMGEEGNVAQRFQVTSMTLPNGLNQVDPRTSKQEQFLTCTNITPIMGGRSIESEDTFKSDAPSSYLQSYTTSTIDTYIEQIRKRAPVNILQLRVFLSKVIEANSYGASAGEYQSNIASGVLQEITKKKNSLVVCAVRSNGTKFDDPDTELIIPITTSLSEKKSPADTFSYLEPNFVKLRANVTVSTKETLPESEIRDQVRSAILGRYGVFNVDFGTTYNKSVVDDISSGFEYVSHVNSFIEVKGNVNQKAMILTREMDPIQALKSPETLVAYKFQFDKSISKNKDCSGLQNFKQSSPYLVRCDIRYKEAPEQDKSFFLYDSRTDSSNVVTLMDAEGLSIKAGRVPVYTSLLYPGFGDYITWDEYDDTFVNRQVRTAQYPFINRITSDDYCLRMKLFNQDPFEQRPLFIDNLGIKKQFKVELVSNPTERVALSLEGGEVTGNYCYRRNVNYFENSKIIFFENYDDYNDPQYATGFLVVPLNRVVSEGDINELTTQMSTLGSTISDMADIIASQMSERVRVDAWARPNIVDFEALYDNDLIFSDEEDVMIEKKFIVK
jgi:hypothetical protein